MGTPVAVNFSNKIALGANLLGTFGVISKGRCRAQHSYGRGCHQHRALSKQDEKVK
jgi:hypothetical protein